MEELVYYTNNIINSKTHILANPIYTAFLKYKKSIKTSYMSFCVKVLYIF
jgi:hypothetical protein